MSLTKTLSGSWAALPLVWKRSSMNLPKREELLLRTVQALKKDGSVNVTGQMESPMMILIEKLLSYGWDISNFLIHLLMCFSKTSLHILKNHWIPPNSQPLSKRRGGQTKPWERVSTPALPKASRMGLEFKTFFSVPMVADATLPGMQSWEPKWEPENNIGNYWKTTLKNNKNGTSHCLIFFSYQKNTHKPQHHWCQLAYSCAAHAAFAVAQLAGQKPELRGKGENREIVPRSTSTGAKVNQKWFLHVSTCLRYINECTIKD